MSSSSTAIPIFSDEALSTTATRSKSWGSCRKAFGLLPHGINPFRALTNAAEPELYLPNPAEWQQASPGGGNSIELVVAKRNPGVSLEAARAEMEGIQSRVRQEIAIRTALGAGRGRVMRQFLGENLSLALLGGASGLLFARAAAPLIARLAAGPLPGFAEANLDGPVLIFAVSLVTGVLFSVCPALFLRQAASYEMLKQGGRTSSGASTGLPVRRFLVAAELALTLVLVIGAGLMVKSFWRMNAHPAEFVPERILTMKVSLAMPQYRDEAKQKTYWPELLRRVESVPGVAAAGVVNAYVRGVVDTRCGSVARGPGASRWGILRDLARSRPDSRTAAGERAGSPITRRGCRSW